MKYISILLKIKSVYLQTIPKGISTAGYVMVISLKDFSLIGSIL
jgi:hypothetical protein